MIARPTATAWNRNSCVGPEGTAGPTYAISRKCTTSDETAGGLSYAPGPTVPRVILTSWPRLAVTVRPSDPRNESGSAHAATDKAMRAKTGTAVVLRIVPPRGRCLTHRG